MKIYAGEVHTDERGEWKAIHADNHGAVMKNLRTGKLDYIDNQTSALEKAMDHYKQHQRSA